MLKPATLYKEELLKKFSEEMYSERMFYYVGYPHYNDPPNLDPADHIYRWAIVDSNNNAIGYFSYAIDPLTDTIDRFGLFSFKPGCLTVPRDIFDKLEELIATHHRISWRVIEGNPAQRGYEAFCKKHNGRILYLQDVTVDLQGKYRGEYMFEIVNESVSIRNRFNADASKTGY